MLNPTISLAIDHNGTWIADMSQSPDADAIRSAFGTAEIPTAFTQYTSGPAVQAAIQALNPDCRVVLAC